MSRTAVGPLPADLARHLATARLGRRVYFYPETDSTNDVAIELARRGEPEGTLVVADHQRRGRGRGGNSWSSPPGRDVLCSLILRPDADARAALAVTLVAAAALSVGLSKLLDVTARVKWPNDVIVGEGKIAGILAESATSGGRVDHVVVGMGINVNSLGEDFPEDLRGRAASCRSLTGEPWDRSLVLADVLGAIEAYYDRFRREGFVPLTGFYESRLWQLGRRVAFERAGARETGVVLGVAGDGALRVELDGGGVVDLRAERIEVVA